MRAAPARRLASPPPPTQDPYRTAAQSIVGYRTARVLMSAVSADLFSLLAASRTAAQVSRRLGWRERPCAVLLDCLAAMGLLEKAGGAYRATRAALEHLTPGGTRSLYHNLRTQALLWEAWSGLDEVLRSGSPRRALLERLADPRFTRDYVLGMREIAAGPALEVAGHLARPGLKAMLDVGCGPGTFSLALLEACPGLRATLLDLPSTLAVTREALEGRAERARASLKPGDYRSASFGRGRWDLVLLSHVTHDEGADDNRRLLGKAFASLRPGGVVAVHDFMVREDRAGPLFPALFSVHMAVYTREGRVYSEAEYLSWLRASGFTDARAHPIGGAAPNASRLLVAVKPGGRP